MTSIFNPRRLKKLVKIVESEEDFVKEAMRFWHWYMLPEMRYWTKETLRRFYEEYKTRKNVI